MTVLVGSSIINLTSGRLDILFIGSMLSMVELGIYGASLRVAMLLALFTGVISTLLLPRAPRALVSESSMRKYLKVSAVYLAGFAFVGICVALVYDQILRLAFGLEYSDAGVVGIVLIGRIMMMCAGLPFQLLLQCSRRPSLFLGLAVLRMVLDVSLLALLIPVMGVLGAATATLVSAVAMTLAMAIITYIYFIRDAST